MLLQLDRISYTPANFTQPLLTDISLSLAVGEWLALTGLTGAGKSTLLRLLNRLSEPTTGEISIDGVNCRTIPPVALRQRLMLVAQEPKLLGMTVREALAYPLKLQSLDPTEIKQRIVSITERLELPTTWFDRTETQLSTGQKQLVSIARGLIAQPQILLLDEPVANLDFATADRVFASIRQVSNPTNMSSIFVTHQLELAVKFSDRLLYLQDGKLAFDRPSSAVDWQSLQQQIRNLEDRSNAEWT